MPCFLTPVGVLVAKAPAHLPSRKKQTSSLLQFNRYE